MSTALTIPPLGDGDIEGKVVQIAVAAGERITAGQTLLEIETDKVVMEVPADRDGVVETICVNVGDSVRQGVVFAELGDVEGAKPAETKAPVAENHKAALSAQKPDTSAAERMLNAEAAGTAPSSTAAGDTVNKVQIVPAGPAARRLARELGIDLRTVRGAGRHGRITKDDIKKHARTLIRGVDTGGAATDIKAPPLAELGNHGPVHREPMTLIAQATARNMRRAWSEIPHAWLQEQIDVTVLEAARQRHKQAIPGVTLTVILCNALAAALQQFPKFNATVDVGRNEFVYRDYIHLGVAVDTERGLVVPVIRDADRKSLVELAAELGQLSQRARDNKLSTADMQGAGMTISNLGGLGTSAIFPLVNWPETAILGIAAISQEPRWICEVVTPRLVMPVTLGFDHRVINGADSARFLAYLKRQLEEVLPRDLNG